MVFSIMAVVREVRLLLKLNDFSLDRYKDLIFEFPERFHVGVFASQFHPKK